MHEDRWKSMTKILEPHLKSLVLSSLLETKSVNDKSLIMNELTVGNFARRIDLAITVNDKLIGYEIKSEADSLTRLNGQLETYLEYFDKIILVIDSKFIPLLKTPLPKNVGLWEVQSASIKIRKKGCYKTASKYKLVDFLDIPDLKNIIKEKKPLQNNSNRQELEKQAYLSSAKKIRNGVLTTLERKYRASTDRFIRNVKDNKVEISDLQLLSRYNNHRQSMQVKRKAKQEFWNNLDTYLSNIRLESQSIQA